MLISFLLVALILGRLDFLLQFILISFCCQLRFKFGHVVFSCYLVFFIMDWVVISLLMANQSCIRPNPPSLCLQIRVFSHTRHMFDEMLNRVFFYIFGWLACANLVAYLGQPHENRRLDLLDQPLTLKRGHGWFSMVRPTISSCQHELGRLGLVSINQFVLRLIIIKVFCFVFVVQLCFLSLFIPLSLRCLGRPQHLKPNYLWIRPVIISCQLQL